MRLLTEAINKMPNLKVLSFEGCVFELRKEFKVNHLSQMFTN